MPSRGGWYCTNCGALASALPDGLVTCRRCGQLGLRGYEGRRPQRLHCPDHPAWQGWDDGGVNDDLGRHVRADHARLAPSRIQLRRTGGWRKPPGAVVVARPTKWGNPWRVTEERPADGAGPRYRLSRPDKGMVGPSFNLRSTAIFFAVQQFRRDLIDGRLSITCADVVAELAGKVLGCWCEPGHPCHADVLLEVANRAAT